jgi:hypothetical protein
MTSSGKCASFARRRSLESAGGIYPRAAAISNQKDKNKKETGTKVPVSLIDLSFN